MAPLKRLAVIWVLLLVLPFHALTAAYLDLRGPAHFHLDDESHEHDDGHSHSHGQGHLERHHHLAGDPTVVAVSEDPLEEGPSGWSATMCVALLSARGALQPPRLSSGITPGRDALLQTRFLERLERPPRILHL